MQLTREKLIGGMFGLEIAPCAADALPVFMNEANLFLVSARACILLLIEQLQPSHVWMPSYLCGSMLQALRDDTSRLRFFPINYALQIESPDWLDEVGAGDLVVLIDYFGYPLEREYVARLKARGAWVLEDASQALLSEHVGMAADFVIYSPRKFLGVPDGGILASPIGRPLDSSHLTPPPQPWWMQALAAGMARREYDLHGGERAWFAAHRAVEAEYPSDKHAMSELSRMLLTWNFDYDAMARQRHANYQMLLTRLDDLAIFPDLPADVVPLGFPIRHPERDRIRENLYAQNIFPPVHWPLPDTVPIEFAASHRLAADIMTLPCDQRYEEQDMQRVADAVCAAMKH